MEFYGISVIHPCKQSGRWQDVLDQPDSLYGCITEIP